VATFITVDDLIVDPEPVDIPAGKRVKDKKTGEEVDAVLRVWPRRPTDVEKQMITAAANGVRRTLRARLADPTTDEHRLRLREPLEEADESTLRQIWVNGKLFERAAEIQHQSLEEREYVPEPEGELVTAAERDEYDTQVEQAEDSRVNNLIEALGSVRRELEEEVKSIPRESLLEAAMPSHIETVVGREWADAYTANLIARCSFSDKNHTKPLFKTVSDVEKLRSQRPGIYQRLADTHKGLLLEVEPTLGF
jgi:hypothetical protein